VKDPVNVVMKEKHFVVKNFYATLVKEARRNFSDAKNQTERWLQAVILPLEVQIKDHKAQLQSRLDNLAKINEKTTTINEQMALVKTAEADLKRQRDMIEGLIMRVSAHAATASLTEEAPAQPLAKGAPPQKVAPEMLQTTKLAAFEAPKPPPAPKPEAPLVSDDLMAELNKPKPPPSPLKAASPRPTDTHPIRPAAPGSDTPDRTQRLDNEERTVRLNDAERTQRMDADRTQRMKAATTDAEKTQQIPKYDPSFDPEATQMLPATEDAKAAETTQRIDDTIWKLEEAKRILQKTNKPG
jgi:hypothetical protein